MQIGLVGKPSVGKSTFFNAATLASVKTASFPFTTIKANQGVAYVKIESVCKEFDLECDPKRGYCKNGYRFVPFKLFDVAGLVPEAHKGKGMGNEFLDDLRQADVLIEVVDASGTTDEKGNKCEPGSYNPENEIQFLRKEIEMWFKSIIEKNLREVTKKPLKRNDQIEELSKKLSGLGMDPREVERAIKKNIKGDLKENSLKIARILRKKTKPILIAANKADKKSAERFIPKLKEKYGAIPCSAELELVLRKAERQGIIDYVPGASKFEYLDKEINEKQKKALKFSKKKLKELGNTGVQQVLNKAVLDSFNGIVVFPVANPNSLTDQKGNVLPDAYVLPKGSTPLDLAYEIHQDIGENFIRAVDCRTNRSIGKNEELEHRDIVKIHHG